MNNNEHLLTIVEPTIGGDATIELARRAVARGGTASVLMVITDRVERDIRAFAASEELGYGEAEEQAIIQLRELCLEQIGETVPIRMHFGSLGSDVVKYITGDTTTIAIPARLANNGLVERIVSYSGRPVIVAPSLAAVA
ncbi:MAG: hypothetical protein HKN07_07115 [Acidimicrobiia bacterium]|nr:hypothetical protein [Acidimicrobiia bacterium]